jgi:hypothetical protein
VETILKRKRTSPKGEEKVAKKMLIRAKKKIKEILSYGSKITEENFNLEINLKKKKIRIFALCLSFLLTEFCNIPVKMIDQIPSNMQIIKR